MITPLRGNLGWQQGKYLDDKTEIIFYFDTDGEKEQSVRKTMQSVPSFWFFCFLLLLSAWPPISDAAQISYPGTAIWCAQKCGNPHNVEVGKKYGLGETLELICSSRRGTPRVSVCQGIVTIEEWEYNLGPGDLFAISRWKRQTYKDHYRGLWLLR